MTIDTTKPLQLDDGTPVEFVSKSGRWICVKYPEEFAGSADYSPPSTGFNWLGDVVYHNYDTGVYGMGYVDTPTLQNVPETTFDPSKPVQTRDGRPVRIICTDASGSYPIAALINGDLRTFTREGSFIENRGEDMLDLVNIPEETVEYMNVYEPGRFPCLGDVVGEKRSKAEADQAAAADRLACLKVTSVNGKRTSVEIA